MKKTVFLLLVMSLSVLAESGVSLYQQNCQNCHGENGELSAVGHSHAITGWSASKTIEALNGYKNGSRNTTGLGSLMKIQINTYSDSQINALANYIATLKK